MRSNKDKNKIETDLLKLIDNNLKKAEKRALEYAIEIYNNRDLQSVIKDIYALLIKELKEKYFFNIMNDFNLMEGNEYRGKSLKKYYSLIMLSHAIDFTFFVNLSLELSLYRKHFIKYLSPKKYFNEFKISNLIKSYFAIVPVYTAMTQYKSHIEHKRQTVGSGYKKSLLFPRLIDIQKQNNNCELRCAIVQLENNIPGSIDEAGILLKIDYKIMIKQLINEDKLKSKKNIRQKVIYSNDQIIEYKSRVLAECIKSDYTRFIKNNPVSN